MEATKPPLHTINTPHQVVKSKAQTHTLSKREMLRFL
jgi:hypothetical protein